MNKNTNFFPHDFNARHDNKLVKLRLVMGMNGIGIYWSLIEMLYEQGGEISLSDIDFIAKDWRVKKQKIEEVLQNFELFLNNSEVFWSESVNRRLKKIESKSIKASESASKRWSNDANALQTQSEGNANKVNKSKVNNILTNVNSQNEILTDDKSDLSNPFLESEKKEKEKTPAKKEKEKMQHWDELVEVWFQFYQSKFFEKPTFGSLPGKNLKDILTLLKKDTEAKGNIWSLENSRSCLKSFLNLAYGIDWYRTHFQLKDLVSNYDSIKQSYTTTKSNERVRDYSIPL